MKYPQISEEIISMASEDQKVREEFFGKNNPNQKTYADLVWAVDVKNHKRMMVIVSEIGYPTISKVGKVASYKAWSIIQHYSRDGFQKVCLDLMEKSYDDVDPQNIAYLKDRILAFSGKKQIYGTQLKRSELTGLLEPFEIEDEFGLNARRASVGLEPMEEYLHRSNKLYKSDNISI